MPVTIRIDGLGELMGQQFSVVSRGQLLGFGMKDNAIQWRVRAGGPWQTLLPGVYLGLTGAPNLLQKEMAALLYAGTGSLITGPMALMHHGLRSPVLLETVDVLVPSGRQRHSTGFVRLHRTKRLPSRIVSSGPVRLVVAARAVADTARLPMPLFNASLYIGDAFLARPDAWWPEHGVAVEVDSREWHLSPADWDRTRQRHDLMCAAGILPLHFSPRQIRREPAEVIRLIKDALDRGLQRPPLPIRTIPCPGSAVANQ